MNANDLKDARAAIGCSGAKLAAALGIDPRTLRRYELGELPVPRAVAIAVGALTRTDPADWANL